MVIEGSCADVPEGYGIKLHGGTSIETLKTQLGEELKINLVGMLGGFQIIQTDSKNIDQVMDKICKKDALAQTTYVYNTSAGEKTPFVPTGEIYVKFKEGTSTKACLDLLEKYNLTKDKQRSERTFIAKITDPALNSLKITTFLQKDPCIEIAEPDLATWPIKFNI
jgi:hypothetical protein